MANTNRCAGVCYVHKDGKQITVGGTVTVSPSSTERESKVGLSGVVGYIERPRVPYIEIEGIADPSTKASDLDDVTDSTITAELANGHTYILRNAWSVAPVEIKGEDGTFTKRYEGMSCDEL